MRALYSLFEKRGFRWHRLSPLSYLKDVALHVFQDSLLEGSLAGRQMALRPVFDSWNGNTRRYRPPVEQFEPLKKAPEEDEPVVVVTKLRIGERHVIKPQARSYSTGGGSQ